jgi:hypothetical protein
MQGAVRLVTKVRQKQTALGMIILTHVRQWQ